ncbi:MAG: glycine dehydrogenase, partial [Actinomycetota bacterium]
MEFAPHTDADIRRMLDVIGARSIDDLFRVIPEEIRLEQPLGIPSGRSEPEILRDLDALAARNRSADDLVCFMGAGAYDHHIPSMVWPILSRGELMTSYTPYQPELSQGVLQALFEYQTMVCELTGPDISNAGLYDGASALPEAVNLSAGATKRTAYVLAGAINPQYAGVLATQAAGLSLERRTVSWDEHGRVGLDALRATAEGAAAVIVQQPNLFGVIEDLVAIAGITHAAGAELIVHADLTSLGVLEAPGKLGAD